MRIAYCIESFYNHGGMERVVSVKANWLAEHGYQVTIIVATQKGLPAAFTISPSVKLIDLNCDPRDFKRSYKGALTQHLCNNSYDITISTGGVELFFLYQIGDNSHKLVEFHFAWNRFFAMSNKFISKIKAFWQTTRQLYFAAKYDKVILLTHADKKFYDRFISNTIVISNPITIRPGGVSNCKSKNAIAIGRLEYQKGFDLLIRCWRIVADKHPDWKLNIYGDGTQRKLLANLINQENLNDTVFLRGNTSDIFGKIIESSIHVCSSRYEGQSLVIMETALCGVPSVAFDCIAGPAELIENGTNGILVNRVGDINRLAAEICKLIEDDALRMQMSKKAHIMSDRFSINNIMAKWDFFLKELTTN